MRTLISSLLFAAGVSSLVACGSDSGSDGLSSGQNCGSIPPTGLCIDQTRFVYCNPFEVSPQVHTTSCSSGYQCQNGALGGAECVLTAECANGDSRCQGQHRQVCQDNRWQQDTCANGCIEHDLGATCTPDVPTVTFRGQLTYEARGLNASNTDWAPTVTSFKGGDFLVASVANGEILDVTTTDAQGNFEVKITAPLYADEDDLLGVFAAQLKDRNDFQLQVKVPGRTGTVTLDEALVQQGFPDTQPWFWRWRADQLQNSTGLHIREADGSAAARLHHWTTFIQSVGKTIHSDNKGLSLTTWFDVGTTWSCGACVWALPIGQDPQQAQMFIPGDGNHRYWSDTVNAHELGHWWMASYGQSPGEGGTHIMGVPTHPGIAWSEGFATWFSSTVRGDTMYYDKQNGLFLWIDIARRQYHDGTPWQMPQPHLGLEQLIDENEVARMLLHLSEETDSLVPLLHALSLPQMNSSPYLRGYQRRYWEGLNEQNQPFPYEVLPWTVPYLADFLDTMVCNGLAAPYQVNAVTQPTMNYPYSGHSALCRSAQSPLQVHWQEYAEQISVTVQWMIPLEADLRLEVPTHPFLAQTIAPSLPGEATLYIPKTQSPTGQWVLPPDVALSLNYQGQSWGVSGTSTPPWQPKAESHGPQWQALAKPIRLKGQTLTHAIAMTPVKPEELKARLGEPRGLEDLAPGLQTLLP